MANDITILYGIITFFIIIGVLAPFLNAEFSSNITEHDPNSITDDLNTGQAQSSISAFKVFGSVISMFFWSFGLIPVWLDLIIFTPLRIILVLIIARNVWIGGGG